MSRVVSSKITVLQEYQTGRQFRLQHYYLAQQAFLAWVIISSCIIVLIRHISTFLKEKWQIFDEILLLSTPCDKRVRCHYHDSSFRFISGHP